MTTATDFDPRAPETVKDPYAFFATLRREAPVYYHPKLGYVLSKYDDIMAVIRNPAVFSSSRDSSPVMQLNTPDPEVSKILDEGWRTGKNLVSMDEPEHFRYRRPLNRAFSAKHV